MATSNIIIAPTGVYPGAGVTYVASDGTQKAATVLASYGTQTKTVENARDGEVQPVEAGRAHIRVITLAGKVYNRYNVAIGNEDFSEEETEDDFEDDIDSDFF